MTVSTYYDGKLIGAPMTDLSGEALLRFIEMQMVLKREVRIAPTHKRAAQRPHGRGDSVLRQRARGKGGAIPGLAGGNGPTGAAGGPGELRYRCKGRSPYIQNQPWGIGEV